jgi:hypothetical protein
MSTDYIEPARPKPYGPILAAQEAEKVRITVKGWGPREPQDEPVIAWVEVEAPGASMVELFVNDDGVAVGRPFAPTRLESGPLTAGRYSLVVEAVDQNGTLLDRTGSPRIVTVLAAPVEPEPEPDRPAGTIQSAHATYLRVRPDGVVDFGGEAPGPWEAVSTEAQS